MARTPVVVELYYSGAWHDLTDADEVYTRDGIQITRGRSNEAGRVNPSSVSLSLRDADQDGKFSPRVPTSPLYTLIGRNTPLRVSTTGDDVTADSFNRTYTPGWGISEFDGIVYTVGGSGGVVSSSDMHIDEPLTATHTIPATNASRYTRSLAIMPVDVTATIRLRALDDAGSSDILGADIEGGLMLRFQAPSVYYHPRVEFNPDQTITASIHTPLGGSLGSATPAAAITYAGQWLVCKAQVVGTTIRMKVWEYGDPEPAAWDLSVTNADITAAGAVGVRSGVATGNTNTGRHVHYQNLTLDYAPRITAEVEAWPTRWNVPGTDVWNPIQAWGIMRRLNAPGTTAAALNAMRRAIIRSTPLAYWPMDDPSDATQLSSGVPGGRPILVNNGMELSSVDGPFGVTGPYPELMNVTREASARTGMTTSGAFTVDVIVRFEPDNDGFDFVRLVFSGGTVAFGEWDWTAGPPGQLSMYPVDRDGALIAPAFPIPPIGGVLTGHDGLWHHVRMTFEQNGADVDLELFVDGVSIDTGVLTSHTIGRLTSIGIPSYAGGGLPGVTGGQSCSIGELTVWDTATPTLTAAQAYAAMNAHTGETAAARIARLCDEESVAVSVLGDAALSTLVGPQAAQPPLELMYLASEADGGILYEPRGFVGLAYRTHHSLYNQTAVVELDYSAGGEVAPPLEPVPDTDAIANDVTVTRIGGGSARVVQETGPLNVQPPTTDADAVGRYERDYQLNLYDDDQPAYHAAWRKHLGTWDEERYPLVAVDITAMRAEGKAALVSQVSSLDVGGLAAVTGTPAWLPPGDIRQLAQGFTETLDSHRQTIAVNATPAGPYDVAVLDDDTLGRLDTDGCELNEALDTTETAVDVISDTTPWIDSGAFASHFPFSVTVGGEEMSVTACAGTGLTQTFTVTRSVNGVVKSHAAGAAVSLTHPLRLAR
jgi:hypothetical protein